MSAEDSGARTAAVRLRRVDGSILKNGGLSIELSQSKNNSY